MARRQTATERETVTFIGSEQVEVRLTEHNVEAIYRAAQALKAHAIITMDGIDAEQNCPIWAVFETRKFRKEGSNVVLPFASKTFTAETSDAAVMWAIAMVKK